MTACPYHARYFNWWDPVWPDGMAKTLNPDVSVRMRGVVEKCTFCHHRFHHAKEMAAASGKHEIDPSHYEPACVEACPTRAIAFGDLEDPSAEVSRLRLGKNSFRLLEQLGTDPKVHYRSDRSWIHSVADQKVNDEKKGLAIDE